MRERRIQKFAFRVCEKRRCRDGERALRAGKITRTQYGTIEKYPIAIAACCNGARLTTPMNKAKNSGAENDIPARSAFCLSENTLSAAFS